MRKRTKIGIGLGVLVLLVAVSIVSAMRGSGNGSAVRIEAVERRDLTASVTASGWIEPHRKVDVQADIMGRVIALNVVEGQRVGRGDVLLRIDPTQYEALVARASAAVNEASSREAQTRANLAQAERAFERTRALAQRDNLVSQQALEEAETQVAVQRQMHEAARFSVAQARSSLAEAQNQLAKTTIRAPMAGVITRLNVEEGETAIVGTMNNPGSLLLTIADLSAMEALVRVDETDVPEIQIGDSASIQIDAYPRQRFTGTVSEIGHSAMNPQTAATTGQGGQGQAVDFEVKIRLNDPPPTLRSNLSATAEIVTAQRASVLSIPIIALTVRERPEAEEVEQEDRAARAAAGAAARQQDEEGVFVAREGKAVFVPVDVGIAGGEHFEVISGLTDQDSVIAGPYEAIRSLSDGDAVRPIRIEPAAGSAAAQTRSDG